MAGDWIKMRTSLWDDPRVSRIVDETITTEATVIGGLYWLWVAADQHTERGLLPGLSLSAIDRKTGVKGLGKALVDVGWISEVEDGIQIERFDDHNGASAKSRAVDAKRKAGKRGGVRVLSNDLPEVVRSSPGQVADESRTGLGGSPELEIEKEKERNKGTPRLAVVGVETLVADGLDGSVAEEWVAYRKVKKAALTPRAWDLVKAEAVKAGWPVQEAVCRAMAKGWIGFEAGWVEKDAKPVGAGTPGWAQ